MTSIFAPLDKAQIPTGYLAELGIPIIALDRYNGILSDSNFTTMPILRLLRARLAACRIAGTDTLPSVQLLNSRLKAASSAANGAIPIALQYMNYATIGPYALRDNLLTVQNEQVFDVANRTQNPYQSNTLFVAAPTQLSSATSAVSFLFRRNLLLSGTGAVPSSLYLDFDDGRGYQVATWGQPLGTTYSAAGTKHIRVKVVFTSGKAPLSTARVGTQAIQPTYTEVRESHFRLEVLSIITVLGYKYAWVAAILKS